MNVKKAIKKISALSIGASLLGASILGASAADLSEYPAMFIEDGVFDGAIIVGTNAIAADTLGAVDIATGMQYGGDLGSDDVTISDGAKIEKSGNRLNINETLGDIETSLDESDLPVILADETLDENEGNNDNEEDYTQELLLTAGSERGQLILDQDDDDAPEGKLYLKFGKGTGDLMYNYTLEFDNKVDYDNTANSDTNEDFETATIKIQGNIYTIIDAKLDAAGGNLSELKLQAGDTTVWLEQDKPITKIVGGEEHEIELLDVNENEDKCGIMVDGQLKWIDTSSSEEVAGIDVGVTDAIIVHSEKQDTDVCEVNLGATEVFLEDGQEVEINGKEIDGSEVKIVNSANEELESINIWYTPEDEIYLSEGDSRSDPVLGNFEFTFANIVADYEEVSLDVSGDDLVLSFNNEDGKEIEIPFYCNDSCDLFTNETADAIYMGTGNDVDDRYYLKGGVCTGTASVTECEGARFLVTQGDEVHVIEIDEIDVNDNETTLKDVTYGGTKTTDNLIKAASSSSFKLPAGGSTAELLINPGANSVTFTGGAGDEIVSDGDQMTTENEMLISITGLTDSGITATNASAVNGSLVFHFSEGDGEVDDTTDTVISADGGDSRGLENNFTISIDASDEEMNIGSPKIQYESQNNVDKDENNDNDVIYYTNFGTRIEYDADEKQSATIYFSNDELYANVFVSPVGANIVVGSDGGQVQVGTARLASEVSDMNAQNVIIVGGPCANDAAAEFLGVSAANCMEGAPDANTAVIKLKESDEGTVAMLVNGYSAIDTRRASRVLGQYDEYNLMGMDVVVTGTDFTDITVQPASEYVSEVEVVEEVVEEEVVEEEVAEE